MTPLRTARLLLREWSEDDREPFAALIADPAVMEHFPAPLSREQSDALLDRAQAHLGEHGWGLWAVEVVDAGLGARTGSAGFTGLATVRFEEHFTPAVEVGWRLVPWAWGHGYATEAATAALAVAFERLGLEEVVSFTAGTNARSQASLRRHVLHRARTPSPSLYPAGAPPAPARQARAVDDTRPLVLTLAVDEASQQRFDALRRAHFPPERNHLGAHVTLFHALPGAHLDEVRALVTEAARREAFDVEVTGVRLLGRGVALTLASADLEALHRSVQRQVVRAFAEAVTAQDRQRLAPHVTVQNKVPPARARALHEQLAAAFTPGTVRGAGLALWRYAGGPWEHLSTAAFTAGS